METFANWIKKNEGKFFLFGSILLALTVILGLIWAYGYEIEPIAFIVCMLSSIFLWLPEFSKKIIPDKKLPRDMSALELIDLLNLSNLDNDWEAQNQGLLHERFYKNDPAFRAMYCADTDGTSHEHFEEFWTEKHPNPSATGYYCKLTYNGSVIKNMIIVSVDGGRAMIPLPDLRDNSVSMDDYQLAKLFDDLNNLDDYLMRSGLSVRRAA